MYQGSTIAIVIPCFKVNNHLLNVVKSIPDWVDRIYLVDDACPENSVRNVQDKLSDKRVTAIYLSENLGVGGAVKEGYLKCLREKFDIVARIDGDGQMNLQLLSKIIDPLVSGDADFTKGNRFFNIEDLQKMPKKRIFGNLGLSFLSKFSTGYWDIYDPNNGFNALNIQTLSVLPMEKIDNRYFFESDLLFRLGLVRARVIDVPMPAIYGQEVSNLSEIKSFFEFLYKHLRNFNKRIFYNYFLREFNLGSLELLAGSVLFSYGVSTAMYSWIMGMGSGVPTAIGTQILVAMTTLSGIQLLLGFLSYDMQSQSVGKRK